MTGGEDAEAAPAPLLGRGPFRWYVTAVFITVSGNWAQNVALALVTLDETDNPAVVGLALSLRHLPLLLLGPWAGSHLDRHSKARIVATTQAIAGVLTSLFFVAAIAGAASTPVILGYCIAAGLCTVADAPSRVALIGELVDRERISKATAIASIGSVLGRVVGPALATVIVAVSSPDWVFLVNALSFFVTARMFLSLDAATRAGRAARVDRHEPTRSLRAVLSSPAVSVPLVMAFAVAVFVLNSQVVLLVLLTDVLDEPESSYGMLLVVMGIGGAAGALAGGQLKAPTLAVLATLTATAGVLLVVLSAADLFVVVIVAGTLGGAVMGMFATSASTFLQLGADDAERGRIMSLQEAAFTGAAPVGAALAGVVTDLVGPRQTFLCYAVVMLAVAALGMTAALTSPNRPAVAVVEQGETAA